MTHKLGWVTLITGILIKGKIVLASYSTYRVVTAVFADITLPDLLIITGVVLLLTSKEKR